MTFCKLAVAAAAATGALAIFSSEFHASALRTDCDVAVIGGGSAGANAAVFLKDKGYNVCVFEKRSRLGGHCHTTIIPVPTGCTTCPNWIDTGVQAFVNTTYLNANGYGSHTLKTDQHIARFVPSSLIIATDFSSFNASAATYIDPNEVNAQAIPLSRAKFYTDADYQAAYTRLDNILRSYPFFEQAGEFPDPIPAELLLPFDQFVTLHCLEPLLLEVFKPNLSSGGMGSFNKLTTFYALMYMRRATLNLFQPSKSAIVIIGGCSTLYSGIQSYLGSNKVFLNSTITSVNRPWGIFNSGKIRIGVTLADGTEETFKVQKLVIAIPPTTSNLQFLDADVFESNLYSKVKTRTYGPGVYSVTGPLSAGFSFAPLDNSTTPVSAPKEGLVSLSKRFPYAPGVLYFQYDTPKTTAQITALVTAQASNISPSLITIGSFSQLFSHEYQPHFSTQDLYPCPLCPNAYTQFEVLQGWRKTYYVGALFSFADSSKVWEATFNLIDNEF